MLLFTPILILFLTLAALGLGNLQRGFRSNWLLVLGGSALAWLSLLFLRLRLPLEANLPAWWAGRGLEFRAHFVLDNVSWTLAFLVSSLLVTLLLLQVEHAMQARWSSWAPTLAAAVATLLACVSGNPLTLLLAWTLLDVVGFGSLMLLAKGPQERLQQLARLPQHLAAAGLLLAAWLLSFYGLQSLLVVLAGGLRLGLWQPQAAQPLPSLRAEQQTLLYQAPLAAGLAALGLAQGATPPPILLLILLPSLYAAFQWLRSEQPQWAYWQLTAGGLAAASAALGQTQALLAFASLLLLGPAMLRAVRSAARLRQPLAVAGALVLCGLPLTGSQGALALFGGDSLFGYGFLPLYAALLAGWFLFATQRGQTQEPNEPWMVAIQRTGLTLPAIVLMGFGLGLLPGLQDEAIALWPAALVAGLAAGLALLRRQITWRPATQVRSRYKLLGQALQLDWLAALGRQARRGLAGLLALTAGLLEGRAGVLWALVVLTLLVSLISSLGVGS